MNVWSDEAGVHGTEMDLCGKSGDGLICFVQTGIRGTPLTNDRMKNSCVKWNGTTTSSIGASENTRCIRVLASRSLKRYGISSSSQSGGKKRECDREGRQAVDSFSNPLPSLHLFRPLLKKGLKRGWKKVVIKNDRPGSSFPRVWQMEDSLMHRWLVSHDCMALWMHHNTASLTVITAHLCSRSVHGYT